MHEEEKKEEKEIHFKDLQNLKALLVNDDQVTLHILRNIF
jgi:hypothetical protein